MRFCTRSLRYSIEVPCGTAGPWGLLSVVVSEKSDWVSNSLFMGVDAVGVDGIPGVFLKDVRRFCAEDLRLISGASVFSPS
jgi:hypothetical protein